MKRDMIQIEELNEHQGLLSTVCKNSSNEMNNQSIGISGEENWSLTDIQIGLRSEEIVQLQ